MMAPDALTPEFALAVLIALMVALVAFRRRGDGYVTFDCGGGQHSACETCSCVCHDGAWPTIIPPRTTLDMWTDEEAEEFREAWARAQDGEPTVIRVPTRAWAGWTECCGCYDGVCCQGNL